MVNLETKDKILIKEAIIYFSRRNYIIGLISFLIIIPFAFAIINYMDLKNCQSKESNGCPNLYVPSSSISINSQEPYLDYKSNTIKFNPL